MIGKIKKGNSFYGCLHYCLNDKKVEGKVQHQSRAEILLENRCFGNAKALASQFVEVARLNRRVSKPVMHVTLNFDEKDNLSPAQLREIAYEFAAHVKAGDHQFIAIQHHDTKHPHIHLVMNRIGPDGKVLSDSHDYKLVAEFCRKMETKFNLRKVHSPNRFLKPGERPAYRLDKRKEALRSAIRGTLLFTNNWETFSRQMKAHGYRIEKARGIAFIDDKGVRTKGSEVGYALTKLERKLTAGRERSQSRHTFHPSSSPAKPTTPSISTLSKVDSTTQGPDLLHPLFQQSYSLDESNTEPKFRRKKKKGNCNQKQQLWNQKNWNWFCGRYSRNSNTS